VSASAQKRIYDLLPVIHRMRDSDRGWPLRALLDIIQEQVDVTRDNITQLNDDWFIETCAEWVVPYIGDLLGVGALAQVPDRMFSLRSFVGNTIAFRRRKGTALVLERLAQSLTRWPAVAVEYFQLLAATQHLGHLRPGAGMTADVSDWDAMRRLDGAFEKTAHTLDVRHIASARGKFNIPSIGEFLCRLQTFEIAYAPATLAGSDPYYRYRFSQIGHDMPLFNPPRDKSVESRNIESDLPLPLPRRPLYEQLKALRAGRPSRETDWNVEEAIHIQWTDSKGATRVVEPQDILISDLSGHRDIKDWTRPAPVTNGENADRIPVAVDPVLGRFTFPPNIAPKNVMVGYRVGFSSAIGGGCYSRKSTEKELSLVNPGIAQVAGGDPTSGPSALQSALASVAANHHAIVEITDNLVYRPAPVTVAPGAVLELRAQDENRPVLVGDFGKPWRITLHKGAYLRIAGLVVSAPIEIDYVDDGDAETETQLFFSHCTLVPGIGFDSNGGPLLPDMASLTVTSEIAPVEIHLDRSLSGPIVHPSKFGRVEIADSAVDGMGGLTALTSGITVVQRSTILGRTVAYLLELGSDSIFDEVPWTMRTQDGCVRYCYMPWDAGTPWDPNTDSKAPRRYHCQPVLALAEATERARNQGADEVAAQRMTLARVKPQFTSRRYGHPGYLQLAQSCPSEIAGGASNEAEMGVFNHLGQPQRLKNLNRVLNDYLRVGLEAGVFFVT
jgi:hypothetical protein